MKKISQEEIVKALADHLVWLESGERRGARLNLDGREFPEGIDLQGANLRLGSLNGASLRRARLVGANLEGADLYDAHLVSADLEGADLEGANLRGAVLEGGNLQGANLERANLERASLRGAKLQNAKLLSANFYDAILRGANLDSANLKYAVLYKANLQGANLMRANLAGANLAGANLAGANLAGANLAGADLQVANFLEAKLQGANLYGSWLQYANFAGAVLEGANLQVASLQGASLRGAVLEGANLEGANLKDADLEGAELFGANLEGADLEGANLEGAILQISRESRVASGKQTRALSKLKKQALPMKAGAFKKLFPEEFERIKAETKGKDFTPELLESLVKKYGVTWAVSATKYRSESQRYCKEANDVLRLNILIDDDVYTEAQRQNIALVRQASLRNNHPVEKNPKIFTIGWVRYCEFPDRIFIEEIQSDVPIVRRGLKDPELVMALERAGKSAEEIEEVINLLAPFAKRFYTDALGLIFDMAEEKGKKVEMFEYRKKTELLTGWGHDPPPEGVYLDLPKSMGMKLGPSEALPEIGQVWTYTPNRRRRMR